MIDLHAHILPGLDDRVSSVEEALDAVRMAIADGIDTIVCTPWMGRPDHERTREEIERVFHALKARLDSEGYPVELGLGADITFQPDVVANIRSRTYLTLQHSRYFLLRVPQQSLPAEFKSTIREALNSGYVPIITHPERSHGIHNQYGLLREVVNMGAGLQVTGDCHTGHMGRRPRYWAERLLDEGLVHVLATDTHGVDHQAPLLSEARALAGIRVGESEAELLVQGRPLAVINDFDPCAVKMPPGLVEDKTYATSAQVV